MNIFSCFVGFLKEFILFLPHLHAKRILIAVGFFPCCFQSSLHCFFKLRSQKSENGFSFLLNHARKYPLDGKISHHLHVMHSFLLSLFGFLGKMKLHFGFLEKLGRLRKEFDTREEKRN